MPLRTPSKIPRRLSTLPKRRLTSHTRHSFWSRFLARSKNSELRLEVAQHVTREIWAITFITLAILTYLALFNQLGTFGEIWQTTFQNLFGLGVNFIPLIFLIIGITLLTSTKIQFNFTRVFGITLMVITLLGIIHLEAPPELMLPEAQNYGGFTGFVASFFTYQIFDLLGAKIILFAIFLIALLITFGLSLRELLTFFWSKNSKETELKINANESLESSLKKALNKKFENQVSQIDHPKKSDKSKTTRDNLQINHPNSLKLVESFQPQTNTKQSVWVPPSLNLLTTIKSEFVADEKSLRQLAGVIRLKLAKFGIEVKMVDVNIGPTVMQFTLKPAEGVKLSRVKNLKDDLALALAAKSIRIEAPIPGKSLVGIEIPNEKRIPVGLKELLLSDVFTKTKSNLRLALGRDVAGTPVIGDLEAMPHLLVAGQTGSGKSVGINSFLLSLIFQNPPSNLRLILVDPKRVELTPYNDIPHLLTPVINDAEKTISALKWAVSEMTRRYKMLANLRVRNILEYNAKATAEQKVPYIVIVIDELADLMMVAGKEVEAAVCRLAQMARAVGIHLIVATQRPSVDVITGLIKANIPTRIAYRVAQGVDSKTILDSVGAEDLLGRGDMLWIPPGQSEPLRIQGTLITTEEVKRVTNAIKLDLGTESPAYNTEVTDKEKNAEVVLPGVKTGTNAVNGGDSDTAVLLAAARVILETKRASASLLQRRLSLGYARAARIIDLLEEQGLVGPAAGAKPRAIFITEEKIQELEARG